MPPKECGTKGFTPLISGGRITITGKERHRQNMGLTFVFDVPSNLNKDKRKIFEEKTKPLEGKIFSGPAELKKAYNDLANNLKKDGIELYKTGFRHSGEIMSMLQSSFQGLVNAAATPEEKSKWQKYFDEVNTIFAEAMALNESNNPNNTGQFQIQGDGDNIVKSSVYSEEAEKRIDEGLRKLNTALREEMKGYPPAGSVYGNKDFIRENLEIIRNLTDYAINGNLMMENLTLGDYTNAVKSIKGIIPGIKPYGVGVKKGADKSYVSDYARLNPLLPLTAPALWGTRLLNAESEYYNKADKKTTGLDDEMQIREEMLSLGSECLYSIDKIRKNIKNENVKEAFPREANEAQTDAIGNRSTFFKWEATHKARRKLIENGWAMADITAIGKMAGLIPAFKRNMNNLDRAWDEYDANKEAGNKPSNPRYSEEERNAVSEFENKLNALLSEEPKTAERRKELLTSLAEAVDAVPDGLKKRFREIEGLKTGISLALQHELSETEKAFLRDPSKIREIAAKHPDKEYTEAEQSKDLQYLAALKQKDAELNNIVSVDPYAHDHIVAMQDSLGGDTLQFANAVRSCIGEKEWTAFKAKNGRTDDYHKALDILTHPDSRFNVSKDHKLLQNVETALKMRKLEAPGKNVSNLGKAETGGFGAKIKIIAEVLIPGFDYNKLSDDVDKSIDEGKAYDRQNEYVDRLNSVLRSPGNLNRDQQKEEIMKCIVGLIMPYAYDSLNFDPDNALLKKENLNPEEKKALETAYAVPFNIKGGLLNAPFADRLKEVLKVVDKGVDRIEALMLEEKQVVNTVNLQPLKSYLKNALKGTASMKINAAEPLIKIGEANYSAPVREIDREKNPIIPGKTRNYTISEIEEKAEIFPIHKIVNAQYVLKEIWGDFYSAQQKGRLTPDEENKYWQRIDEQYSVIENLTKDLMAKQKENPDFVHDNMRTMLGQSGDSDSSFEDMISGSRALQSVLRYITPRREARQNGWPMEELGLYTHLWETGNRIDNAINKLEKEGEKYKPFVDAIKDLNGYLKDKVLSKPYEKDPEKRAEIYDNLAKKLPKVWAEREKFGGLDDVPIDLRTEITDPVGFFENVNPATEAGGMPLAYEIKLAAAEAKVEAAEKVKQEIEELKETVDPIVYNDLKRDANSVTPPKQNKLLIDTEFVEKVDVYLNSGVAGLKKEVDIVRAGKETTLEAKTGLKTDRAINAVRNMLDAADSAFHFDSSQYKDIKKSLDKFKDGTATQEDRQRLTDDVKKWLTDPKYDRIHKHSKKEFDNNRFNIMFTLANELDPGWAKENFADMNIAALHGEKADNTSFHNVHEFTNFMHRQMADLDLLNEVEAVGSQRWYLKTDSYGQKGLVEEVLRVKEQAGYREEDALLAEASNLSKLLGSDDPREAQSEIVKTFRNLNAYRKDLIDALSVNDQAQYALRGDNQLDEQAAIRFNKESSSYLKNFAKYTRKNALKELKDFLGKPENRENPFYKKAVLAYGTLDPRAAHEYIVGLHNDKSIKKDNIRKLNLVTLEKEEGLDLGGRKAFRKIKRAKAQQPVKEQKPPERS